jgi:hypothetical protein
LLKIARAVAALRRRVTWADSFDALARHVRKILPDKGATAA